MRFNDNSKLAGKHAFLSASKGAWVNYSEEKLERVFAAGIAHQRGTELHKFANDAIRLRERLPDIPRTLNMYVNDAIGFRMSPELTLFYSINCFGTADALSFRQNKLRVHDLKTGTLQTSERQLEIYAALFCLEYQFRPFDIEIELRIYQNNEVREYVGDPVEIDIIMKKIVQYDRVIERMKEEAE